MNEQSIVYMSSGDVDLYRAAAKNLFPHAPSSERRAAYPNDSCSCECVLERSLGFKMWTPYIGRRPAQDRPAPPEVRQLLEMLAGPHGRTILKTYQIKKGIISEPAQ